MRQRVMIRVVRSRVVPFVRRVMRVKIMSFWGVLFGMG